MSSSRTTIANEALTLIRAKNQFTDVDTNDDPNAKSARMFLDEHINEALEEFDLRLFRRTVTLADITDSEPPPPDWIYRYAMPADCVVPRRILVEGSSPEDTPIPFEVELLPDGLSSSILTDTTEPYLRYTTNIRNDQVTMWPHNFRRAITYRLASSLATSIKESPKMAAAMMQFYVDAIAMARYVDESSHERPANQVPASIRRRRGGV